MMAKKLIAFGIIFVVLFSLAGCDLSPYDPYKDERHPVVSDDYFYYQLYKEEGYARVLEMTDLGKEQEVLVIQSYVEGLPVTTIGLSMDWGTRLWRIKSDKLKKVYIPYSIGHLPNRALDYCVNLQEIVYLAALNNYPERSITLIDGSKQLSKDANLTYKYNYENAPNQNYFWIDYITENNLYLSPLQPERDGYTFVD